MFSIEATFASMRAATANGIAFEVLACPRPSQGLWSRLLNLRAARRAAGDIHHILGDVHYLALATPPATTVLTIHDCGFAFHPNPIKRALLRWFWLTLPARRAARVCAISEKTKSEILSLANIDPDKIVVIPDCIDDAFQFAPREFNSAQPVVLQIGTTANKNIPRLIAALSGLPLQLHIVGKVTAEIESALREHGVACRFSHRLPLSELVETYRQADIVSFVSTYEGFGMPIVEAQAVGRAVLTSDIEPMRTVAAAGAAFADPYSVDSIRAQLIRLAEDRPWRESLIARGLENAAKYRPAGVAAAYTALYREVLAENAPS